MSSELFCFFSLILMHFEAKTFDQEQEMALKDN